MSGNHRLVNGTAIAVFGQLDTANTTYDDVTREPVIERANADDRIGTVSRAEVEYKIRVQVEDRVTSGLAQMLHGQQRERVLELTADWRELINADLVDANGDVKIRNGARLIRLEDRCAQILSNFPNADGMYVESWTKEPTIGVPRTVTWRMTPRRKGV